MSYALYKFHKAILSLDGTGLQKKEWLASSYMHHIIHLRDADLPEAVREDFQDLRSRLTRVPGKGPMATLEESVKLMDDREVNSIINHIILIYKSIRHHEKASAEV